MNPATPTEFELLREESGRALYRASGEGSPRAWFLLAARAPDPLPETLDMASSWRYPGAYLLSEGDPVGSKEAGSVETLEELALLVGMARPAANARMLAWLRGKEAGEPEPAPVLAPITWTTTGGGALAADCRVPFGNNELLLPRANGVTITEAGFALAGERVQFERRRRTAYPLPPEDEVEIGLGSAATGRLVFGAFWGAFSFFGQFRDNYTAKVARGGELRYFVPDGEGGAEQLLFPVFAEVPSSGPGNPTLRLDVELDPLAPFAGDRTRMLFRPGSDPGLRCEVGFAPAGGAVALAPVVVGATERAGFWFGARPAEGSAAGPSAYLAPLGPFELSFEGDEERLMCGLNSLEFLTATNGDRLVFEPSRPAHATGGGADEALLDDTFTTSWVEFVPRPRGSAVAGEVPAYFGQPDASTNYGRGVIPPVAETAMEFPAAVASRVRQLPDGSAPPFPLALYGGATGPFEGKPAPDPDTMAGFEGGVLAAERGALLRKTAAPPGVHARADGTAPAAFAAETAPAAPVFADASGKGLEGGTTSTPQGFVVTLNDGKEEGSAAAGTWAKVDFAISDNGGTFSLAAPTKGQAVDPWLATSLIKDQLFLVLSDWDHAPAMSGRLTVGGFDFEVVPEGKERSQTVLVFKFSTARSLAELIRETAAWEAKEHLVGEPKEVAATEKILVEALKAAEKAKDEPDDPFGYFRDTIAAKPGWTGLLAFNCLVPGTGMPADLQMLCAGMEGPLRAHHFGVELNRVERAAPKPPGEEDPPAVIVESSLFGVIHYWHEAVPEPSPPRPPEHDFEFTLRELNVAIRNSAVTDFHSRVWVRANRLFGRAVRLESATAPEPGTPPNTITLSGQYQRHGEVGTVTFGAPAAGTFAFGQAPFVRVLSGMWVGGASLTPVSSVEKEGGKGKETEITAQVTLSGSLMFEAAPIPGVKGLDLFSYGPAAGDPPARDGSKGIGVAGFGLTVTCTLYEDGSKTPTTVVADLSALQGADNRSGLRPDSLVRTLPLTLKGVLAAEPDPKGGGKAGEGGLDTGKLGALPVNVLELSGAGGRVTAKPDYALQFNLPMGSLGGLADAHASLEATLILGWGPSSFTPDDDGIGVFVALPFVSAGAFGFELQGLLKTTFGDANLARVTPPGKGPTYVILFNNIAITVLGQRFPPRVITDFILFANPEGGSESNLGWSLAATLPPASKATAAIEPGAG